MGCLGKYVAVPAVLLLLIHVDVASPAAALPTWFVEHHPEYSGNLDTNLITKGGNETKHVEDVLLKHPFFFAHMFEIFNIKKFLERLEESASSFGMCLSCKLSVALLQHYVESGSSEDEIGVLVDRICKLLHIETPRVCKGLTVLFRHEVVQVLSRVALAPKEVCGLMIGASCSKFINPLHNWTVPFTPFPKPPVKPVIPPKPNMPILRVLHLSDVHLDPYYQEGYRADCGEPLCCRVSSGLPSNSRDAAGRWGDYRYCDTPLRTLESSLKHISKTHKIDYVIWTGDIPPHDIWNNSRKEASYLLHEVTNLMKKYFNGVPVFPALGNHESSPVNSFPIPEVKGNDSISWLYNELALAWSSWLPGDAMPTLKHGAYYSVLINPGFRIISINMNYCNNLNWWLLLNTTDPAGELTWLVNELQLAELKGEKVHIIGHIPPGNSDCLRVWSDNYYNIINRYESTVIAQFFGHTHMDEYEVFYDSDDHSSRRATSIAYIGPSITTYDGVNPSYRIYTVDGNRANSTRMVLDHETYYMNLTEANLNNNPQWKFEYSAYKAYKMSSLLPSEWDKVTQRLETNDSFFQQFYRYYVQLSDYIDKPCKNRCKEKILCRLQRGRSHDQDLC